jgi:creatinine amidohydrolase
MRYEELSVPKIERLDRDKTIMVLPIGSVEQHGRHMPLGTDTILARSVSMKAAERLPGRVVVMPSPWYGLSAHHMHFAGTITLQASSLIAIVEDIVASLVTHRFRRILIVNGHGGNSGVIDVLASTLGHRFYGNARIACLTYFNLARDAIAALRSSGPGGMGHACEFETAMMQHVRADLVDPAAAITAYPDTGSSFVTTDLLESSPVHTYHDFSDLSQSGTFGDPSFATPEKGASFHAAVVDELVRFIEDFSAWKIGSPPSSKRDA